LNNGGHLFQGNLQESLHPAHASCSGYFSGLTVRGSRFLRPDEILPWDFIDAGVNKKFLIHEWEQAKKETVTPNCIEINICVGFRKRFFPYIIVKTL